MLALNRLDEACVQLQRQGNYLEALESMERGLVLRQHFYGTESEEVWTACRTIGEMCNLLAMTYLQQEDFSMVLELLKKAEILTERDAAGKAATFNNLACYYRRQGKLHSALTYLQKALKIEARLSNVQNPADTHINACAVLSQLGKHAAALEHAQTALILLQEELLVAPGTSASQKPPQADRIAVLAIAYHNIGVEQEFLKRFEHSILSYRKGVEVAERYLGSKHRICNTLKKSLLAAKKSLAMVNDKLNKSRKTSVGTTTLPPIGGRKSLPGTKGIMVKKGTTRSSTSMKTEEDAEKFRTLKEEVIADSLRLEGALKEEDTREAEERGNDDKDCDEEEEDEEQKEVWHVGRPENEDEEEEKELRASFRAPPPRQRSLKEEIEMQTTQEDEEREEGEDALDHDDDEEEEEEQENEERREEEEQEEVTMAMQRSSTLEEPITSLRLKDPRMHHDDVADDGLIDEDEEDEEEEDEDL